MDVERDAVEGAPVCGDPHLDKGAVRDGFPAADKDLPVAVSHLFHRVFLRVPAVEVADEGHLLGAGRPFAVVPAVAAQLEAVVEAAVCKIRERAVPGEAAAGVAVELHPQLEIGLEGGEVRVGLDDL